MSNLLRRIDPDGTLLAKAGGRFERGRSGVGPYDDWALALFDVLAERGLLRDPDEPTLAEVREKVRSPHFDTEFQPLESIEPRNRYIEIRGWDRCKAAVLALLQPRKPEPRFRSRHWSDNPPSWLIIDGAEGESGRQVGTATNEADARTIVAALNAGAA